MFRLHFEAELNKFAISENKWDLGIIAKIEIAKSVCESAAAIGDEFWTDIHTTDFCWPC